MLPVPGPQPEPEPGFQIPEQEAQGTEGAASLQPPSASPAEDEASPAPEPEGVSDAQSEGTPDEDDDAHSDTSEEIVVNVPPPHGYIPARSDQCLLVRMRSTGSAQELSCAILAYVDNFLVTGPDAAHGKQLLTKLFPCKDLGTVSRYLGMEIAINEQMLTISQQGYLEQLLQRTRDAGVAHARPPSVPLSVTPQAEGDDTAPVRHARVPSSHCLAE